MNLDGITLTIDRDTLKVTLARGGCRVVIRFVEIDHLLNWMYLVGTVKHDHPPWDSHSPYGTTRP